MKSEIEVKSKALTDSLVSSGIKYGPRRKTPSGPSCPQIFRIEMLRVRTGSGSDRVATFSPIEIGRTRPGRYGSRF